MVLQDDLKRELLALKYKDITVSNISLMFGNHGGKDENGKLIIKKPKFRTTDTVYLKAGEWINKNDEKTNVGIILFNKIFLEPELHKFFDAGMVNKTMTKKEFNKFYDTISNLMRTEKIPVVPTFTQFLKDYEFWGLKGATIFCPSYSMNIIKPNKKIMEMKKEGLKKEDLTDKIQMVQFEDKLVSEARKEMDKDPAYSLYESGARGSFDNDYKNISIALGPILNPSSGEFRYVSNNYIDGMEKEDLVSMGNFIVTSALPKSVGTAVSGYKTKKFYAIFQDVVVGEEGTDCNSKVTLKVRITEKNSDMYIYQYIVENGKLIELNDDNISSYIGKDVNLRSPMFCTDPDCICNACAGNRPYILQIKNQGLTCVNVTNTLLNKRMKLKHNTKAKLNTVNADDLLL